MRRVNGTADPSGVCDAVYAKRMKNPAPEAQAGSWSRPIAAASAMKRATATVVSSPWLIAVTALFVLVVAAFPWAPGNPAVYSGLDPSLSFIDTHGPGTANVEVNSGQVFLTTGNKGRAALHVATATDSFSAAFAVAVNEDHSLVDWTPVSVTVVKPASARYFVVSLASAHAAVLFDDVQVRMVNADDQPIAPPAFTEDFHDNKLAAWKLVGSGQLTSDSPSSGGHSLLLGTASEGQVGAFSKAAVPVTTGAQRFSVGALVRRTDGAGAFKIGLDWLDQRRKHVAFSPSWTDWASYLSTGVPFEARLWFPLHATSIGIRFESTPLRQIAVRVVDGKSAPVLTVLGTYSLGRLYRLAIDWSRQSVGIRLTQPDGGVVDYKLDRSTGFGLFSERFVDLSVYSVAGIQNQLVEIDNVQLIVLPKTAFGWKVADPRLSLVTWIALILIALLVIRSWLPSLGRARVRQPSRAKLASGRRRWRLRVLAVLSVVAACAVYAVLAPIDAFPFDRLAQESYSYVADKYGLAELYQRTSLIPDAAVRGGNVPWSNVPFAYMPLMAYPYWAIGEAWRLVGGTIHPLQDRVFMVFWKLALASFVIIDAALLYKVLRHVRRRPNQWAAVGTALFLFNPAVIFDASVWGETEAILWAALLASFLGFISGRPRLGWSALVISALVKQTAFFALPILAIYALKRYGVKATLIESSWGVLVGFALVAPLVLMGYSPLTVYQSAIGQVLNFGNPVTSLASADTFSLWTLVNGLHGLHGMDRIWAPNALAFSSGLTFSTAGTAAFAVLAILVIVKVAITPSTKLSAAAVATAISVLLAAYTTLSTVGASRYLLLALPFVIVSVSRSTALTRVAMVVAMTVIPFVSMYGVYMQVLTKGEWPEGFLGLGSPTTNALSGFVYGLYTSDFGITVLGVVLLSLTVTLVIRLISSPDLRAQPYAVADR
jgi:hypothetical protein